MKGEYRFKGIIVKRTGSPRIEGIEFTTILRRGELDTPLIGEYTYEGKEVEEWQKIYMGISGTTPIEAKILEKKGNYVKWSCFLPDPDGKIRNNPNWGSTSFRMVLYAVLKESIFKFSNKFMKRGQETIELVGKLSRKDMLMPQIGEYTYIYTDKDVKSWEIEEVRERLKPIQEVKILEQKGNYVKFQFKLLDEKGFSPDPRDNRMNIRIWLYPKFEAAKTGFVGAKKSKVYHVPECAYCRMMKRKIVLDDISNRRPCRRCGR